VTETNVHPLMRQAPSDVDVDELAEAVGDLQRDAEAAETEMALAIAKVELKRTQRDQLARYRDFVAEIRGIELAQPATPDHNGAAPREASGRGVKRQAVLDLLADGTERTKPQIRRHLINIGLMGDSDKESHSLSVILSRMYRKGEIARARTGVYQSLSAAAADSPSRLPVGEVEA
jgi:hypothetical protein